MPINIYLNTKNLEKKIEKKNLETWPLQTQKEKVNEMLKLKDRIDVHVSKIISYVLTVWGC